MSLDQLDTTLVVLSTGGKETLLDPGEKMCPFGTLNWRHSGARGIGQSAQGLGSRPHREQSYKQCNSVNRVADLTLDAHGGITGKFRIVMTGQEAYAGASFALRNDGDELKKSSTTTSSRVSLSRRRGGPRRPLSGDGSIRM